MSDTRGLRLLTTKPLFLDASAVVGHLERTLIPLGIIAGLVFVFVGNGRPLWLDEVSSLVLARDNLQGLLEHLRNDDNLPAYYLILHQWMALLGDSEAAARGLSGLLYLATVGIVILIALYLFNDKRSAYYSGFFYLISTQAIHQAQNIRSYALLGFCASLSTLFYIRLLRSATPALKDTIACVAVNVFGSFTHIWFLFLIAAEFVVGLWFIPRRYFLRVAMLASLTVFPFAMLWGLPLLNQLGNGATASLNSWMPSFQWLFVPDIFLQYYGGMMAGAYFYIACILLVLPFRDVAFCSFLHQTPIRILIALVAAAISLSMVVCVFKPIYWPGRYTIIALPALASIVGVTLARFANRPLLLCFCYALLVLTIVNQVGSRNDLFASQLPPRQSDRYTAAFIRDHARKNDVLVFTSLSRVAVDYYLKQYGYGEYFREMSFPLEIDHHPFWRDVSVMLRNRHLLEVEAERAVETWKQAAVRDGSTIWVLYGGDLPVSEILKQQLDRRLTLEQELGLQGPFHSSILKYIKTSDSSNEIERD